MSARFMFAIGLSLTLACGGDTKPTSTSDSGTGDSTGAGTGGSTGPTTSATASGTGGETGGTGGGTEGASGSDTANPTTGGSTSGSTTDALTEGGGSGGSGSGMACVKWYAAIAETYTPICECEVQKGTYDTVDECMMALAPASDCACTIFADSPETAELLHCYEMAASKKAKCLEMTPDLCLGGTPLDLCIKDELDALTMCGAPPAEVCTALKDMCGEAVPPICGP